MAKPLRRPHGRQLAGPGGVLAYVPANLPPPIAWDERLAGAGIVALSGEAKRNRVYCARALLDILEEPPR